MWLTVIMVIVNKSDYLSFVSFYYNAASSINSTAIKQVINFGLSIQDWGLLLQAFVC